MTIDNYNRATEILDEINECKYRINQFQDIANSNIDEYDVTEEEKVLIAKGIEDAKLYINDLKEIMKELEMEFSLL